MRHYEAEAGPELPDRLFLDSIEVTWTLHVSLAFDFGDLDMLLVRLDQWGKGEEVVLRP